MSKIDEQRKRYESASDVGKNAKEMHNEIMKQMDNATSCGHSRIEYIIPVRGRKLPEYAHLCAQQLYNEGYHVRTGCRSTTSSGNERPFIVVSLKPFPEKRSIFKSSGFWIKISLLAISAISALIGIIILIANK